MLTAAHCVNEERLANRYRVRLGTVDLASGQGTTFRIDRIVRHADFDPDMHANDIALVHFVGDSDTHPDPKAKIAAVRLLGTRPDDVTALDAPGYDLDEFGQGKEVPGSSIARFNQYVKELGWGKTAPGSAGR